MPSCRNLIIKGYNKCDHIRSYRPKPIVRKEYIEEAAKLINEAERPFVIFGQGVILGRAENEFKAFIEKSGIPAAWTILGLSAIADRSSAECWYARHAWQLRPECIDQ